MAELDQNIHTDQLKVMAAAKTNGVAFSMVRIVENAYEPVEGVSAATDPNLVWSNLQTLNLIPASAT